MVLSLKREILRHFVPQNDIPLSNIQCSSSVILNVVKNLFIWGIAFILFFTPSKIYAEDFKRALPGRSFSFPQVHFSHPEFKTEWWYYSGHLQSLDRRSYGYQLTFFRTGLRRETKNKKSKWTIQNLYFVHLALTDESKGRFEYREKIHRGSLGEAGASSYKTREKTIRVWIEGGALEGGGPGMKEHFLKAGDKD